MPCHVILSLPVIPAAQIYLSAFRLSSFDIPKPSSECIIYIGMLNEKTALALEVHTMTAAANHRYSKVRDTAIGMSVCGISGFEWIGTQTYFVEVVSFARSLWLFFLFIQRAKCCECMRGWLKRWNARMVARVAQPDIRQRCARVYWCFDVCMCACGMAWHVVYWNEPSSQPLGPCSFVPTGFSVQIVCYDTYRI